MVKINKFFEEHYDIYSFNNLILDSRKKKKRVSTILKELVPKIPLDEIIILNHVLMVLDNNNLAVSRKEIRTAFNLFYNEKYHGNKQEYLNWIYKEFHIKQGTITYPQNYRKRAITVTRRGQSGSLMKENSKVMVNDIGDENG